MAAAMSVEIPRKRLVSPGSRYTHSSVTARTTARAESVRLPPYCNISHAGEQCNLPVRRCSCGRTVERRQLHHVECEVALPMKRRRGKRSKKQKEWERRLERQKIKRQKSKKRSKKSKKRTQKNKPNKKHKKSKHSRIERIAPRYL